MVGIDIVEVKRIEKLAKSEEHLKRILTDGEVEYVNGFKNKFSHIAGFFCVKEAVMKALEDCKQISFKDIEVAHKKTGKPYVKLYGKAQEIFNRSGFTKIQISISQESNYATAICILT